MSLWGAEKGDSHSNRRHLLGWSHQVSGALVRCRVGYNTLSCLREVRLLKHSWGVQGSNTVVRAIRGG